MSTRSVITWNQVEKINKLRNEYKVKVNQTKVVTGEGKHPTVTHIALDFV